MLRARDIIPRKSTRTPGPSHDKRATNEIKSERPVKRARHGVSIFQAVTITKCRLNRVVQSSSMAGKDPVDVKPDVGVLDLTGLDDSGTKPVKRERGAVPPIVPGEVIDLT